MSPETPFSVALARADAANKQIHETYGQKPWFRDSKIVLGGSGLRVEVQVEPSMLRRARAKIPESIEEVPVKVIVVL